MRSVGKHTLVAVVALSATWVGCTTILGDFSVSTDQPDAMAPEGGGQDVFNGSDTGKDVYVPPDSAGCAANQFICNGACVAVNDPKNCGRCGHDCTGLANLTTPATCSAGTCTFTNANCALGFAHCSGNPDDGCETDITKPANCGACNTSCPPTTPVCTQSGGAYSCATGCTATQTLCNGTCTDPQTDPNNCLTCGHQCTIPTNGKATCTSGACGIGCNNGYHQCGPTTCSDSSSTQSCGTACAPCQNPPSSNATCSASGQCGFVCNGTLAACNGQCVDETSDNANCNGCGVRCKALEQCTNSACACTKSVCNGTCVDTQNDPNNCGACGHSCLGSACSAGLCTPTGIYTAGSDNVYGVAVDGSQIYWVSSNGYVKACPLSGVCGTPALLGPSNVGYQAVAADPSSPGTAWAANTATNTVYRVAAGSTLPLSPNPVVSLSFGLGNTLYLGANTQQLMSVPRNGGPTQTLASGLDYVSSIWFDASSSAVYVLAQSGKISRVNIPGNLVTVLGYIPNAANIYPQKIAAAGGNVFMTTLGSSPQYTDGAVWICPNTGCPGGVPQVMAANQQFVASIITDGTRVFWPSQANTAIMYCPVAGCSGAPSRLTKVNGLANRGLAIDAQFLYWGDDEDGIYKVAK